MTGPSEILLRDGCRRCKHTTELHRRFGCWAEVWNGQDYGFCACKRYERPSVTVLERAQLIYLNHRAEYRHVPQWPLTAEDDAKLARPFGRPSEMPEMVWRVSPYTWEELVLAVPHELAFRTTGERDLLFGFPVRVDPAAADDLMELRESA